MARSRYRRILLDGKYEYLWSKDGKWVRAKNKWTLAVKVEKPIDPEEEAIKKEIAAVVKGNQFLKRRISKIVNLHRKLYYAKVWKFTEENDLTTLKYHDKRGFKKYHLDHIYPTSAGFKNGIPPECIADIRNLRFIHHRKNMKKRADITDEGVDIISKLIVEYKTIT